MSLRHTLTGFQFPQHKSRFKNRLRAKHIAHNKASSGSGHVQKVTFKVIREIFVPSHRKNNIPRPMQ